MNIIKKLELEGISIGIRYYGIKDLFTGITVRYLLGEVKRYFNNSSVFDNGNNRNSVNHGYMHFKFWEKQSFEQLIHDIARLSKYSRF